jgi:hypothetical protein
MLNLRSRWVVTIVVILLAYAPSARAQGVEVSPFTGYLFGNDLFEAFAGPLDVDGAASLGVIVDVPIYTGLQFEALYSHQSVDALSALGAGGRPVSLRIAADHFQAGALQEYGTESVRPFVTGTLGLTHVAVENDHEVRFTAAGGGGVKLFPSRHVGVRFDGRVLATFIDAGTSTAVCGGARGTCLVSLHLNIAWQAVFTAAVVVTVP